MTTLAFILSGYFSYFHKYETFPAWAHNIRHWQRPLSLYHALNYKYGIWILNALLKQDFKEIQKQTRIGIDSPTNIFKCKIEQLYKDNLKSDSYRTLLRRKATFNNHYNVLSTVYINTVIITYTN